MYIPVYVYIQCISIWNFLLFVYLFNHISTHLFIFMCVYIDFGVTTMCDIFVFIMCYLLKPDRLVPIKHDCNYCKALNSYRWAVVIALECFMLCCYYFFIFHFMFNSLILLLFSISLSIYCFYYPLFIYHFMCCVTFCIYICMYIYIYIYIYILFIITGLSN